LAAASRPAAPVKMPATRQAIMGMVFRRLFMTQIASIQSIMARSRCQRLVIRINDSTDWPFFDNLPCGEPRRLHRPLLPHPARTMTRIWQPECCHRFVPIFGTTPEQAAGWPVWANRRPFIVLGQQLWGAPRPARKHPACPKKQGFNNLAEHYPPPGHAPLDC